MAVKIGGKDAPRMTTSRSTAIGGLRRREASLQLSPLDFSDIRDICPSFQETGTEHG
jgi:hypothetical protein